MGSEFRDLFRRKSPAEVMKQHGLRDAKMVSVKARIAAWVEKIWNDIPAGDVALFTEARLIKEFNVEKISPYVRSELKKRGIDLGKRMRRQLGGPYYVVTKTCE